MTPMPRISAHAHTISIEAGKVLDLPPEVEEVFREFRTCEFSTLTKKGTPVTWPVAPLFKSETGRFFITTSIGLPQKAFNVRLNPRVSMLFSDPTGSGLTDPPAVLVQGDAEAPDQVITSSPELEELFELVSERQPAGAMFSADARADWYYMRLLIWVTPRRILWWDQGDFTSMPHELVVNHVG